MTTPKTRTHGRPSQSHGEATGSLTARLYLGGLSSASQFVRARPKASPQSGSAGEPCQEAEAKLNEEAIY
jgi:hypothetical protein